MVKVTVPRMTTEAREMLVKQARMGTACALHGHCMCTAMCNACALHVLLLEQARKLGEASKTSVRNVRQALHV